MHNKEGMNFFLLNFKVFRLCVALEVYTEIWWFTITLINMKLGSKFIKFVPEMVI